VIELPYDVSLLDKDDSSGCRRRGGRFQRRRTKRRKNEPMVSRNRRGRRSVAFSSSPASSSNGSSPSRQIMDLETYETQRLTERTKKQNDGAFGSRRWRMAVRKRLSFGTPDSYASSSEEEEEGEETGMKKQQPQPRNARSKLVKDRFAPEIKTRSTRTSTDSAKFQGEWGSTAPALGDVAPRLPERQKTSMNPIEIIDDNHSATSDTSVDAQQSSFSSGSSTEEDGDGRQAKSGRHKVLLGGRQVTQAMGALSRQPARLVQSTKRRLLERAERRRARFGGSGSTRSRHGLGREEEDSMDNFQAWNPAISPLEVSAPAHEMKLIVHCAAPKLPQRRDSFDRGDNDNLDEKNGLKDSMPSRSDTVEAKPTSLDRGDSAALLFNMASTMNCLTESWVDSSFFTGCIGPPLHHDESNCNQQREIVLTSGME